MNEFRKALNKKIIQSLKNNYGIENYDEFRFGEYPINNGYNKRDLKPVSIVDKIKIIIKKGIRYDSRNKIFLGRANKLVDPNINEFENIWRNINSIDKECLVSLLTYRILGYTKVKLTRNNNAYWEAIVTAKSLANYEDTYDPKFMHFILQKFDLKPIGFDLKLFFSEIGVAIDFIIEQYAYKINDKSIVIVEKGDTVLDVGGCWGDTALYFAHKVGVDGKVYSFEFIPNNIKLFNINIALNPTLMSRIELIQKPISNVSGNLIYYKDNGPGSQVKLKPFEEQSGTALTITIDDYVKLNNVSKIDFIKMDIEGAEPFALEGAIETIRKFRPKLAIAIYHSMNDFVTIPNWIINLNLDYDIFIGHYTIHAEETICFAKPRS